MAFVPKGYLPLTIAIERLAQALQISVESARTEMQSELYGRSIVASVMVSSTGQMFEVKSPYWGTEMGLIRLEFGELQLPAEIDALKITVWGQICGESEHAPVFLTENDLQRLIDAKLIDAKLKSEGAREAAPRSISDEKARSEFQEWRKARGNNIPSLKEDHKYMKKKFGVSRKRVIALRREDGVKKLPRGDPRSKPK
jgi:hypothetical protein